MNSCANSPFKIYCPSFIEPARGQVSKCKRYNLQFPLTSVPSYSLSLGCHSSCAPVHLSFIVSNNTIYLVNSQLDIILEIGPNRQSS